VLDLLQRAFDHFVERAVEVAQQLDPVEIRFLDLVELRLHPGGELNVHDVGESWISLSVTTEPSIVA
jgi:hypothetical protein